MRLVNLPRVSRSPRRLGGFTLIELVIAVAVVGILASIAYPSYLNQIRKSRRSDAVAALSEVQQAQERWRANNTTYAGSAELPTTAPPAGLGVIGTSKGGYYTMVLSANSATGYTLTATAVSGKSQAGDTGCSTLTVTVENGTARNEPPSCWSR